MLFDDLKNKDKRLYISRYYRECDIPVSETYVEDMLAIYGDDLSIDVIVDYFIAGDSFSAWAHYLLRNFKYIEYKK